MIRLPETCATSRQPGPGGIGSSWPPANHSTPSTSKPPVRTSPDVKTLLVATTNPGKVREITAVLAGLPVELVTLVDRPYVAAPEETGRTFGENARQKALYYAAAI